MKNLDFTVRKEQLQTISGVLTDSYGIVREDTQKVLGIFKKGYEMHQPSETIELVKRIADNKQYELGNSYCIDGGKRIALQLNLADEKVGDDVVKKYITALDSFDGTTQLSFGISSKVMSCKNQFHQFKKSLKNRARHTVNMRSKVNELINSMLLIEEAQKEQFDIFRKWASTPVSQQLAIDCILNVFDVDSVADLQEASTQKKNQVQILVDNVNSEMAQKGRTKWGLFNGFTYYTNHSVNRVDVQESLFDGTLADFNNKAFNLVSELF